jgi:hypothetical protein
MPKVNQGKNFVEIPRRFSEFMPVVRTSELVEGEHGLVYFSVGLD